MTTIERARRIVQDNHDRPFLVDGPGDRTFTYGEFDRLARSLAAALHDRGLCRGDRVAILMRNSPEFAALYFACLYAGLTAVPVNPGLHAREVAFILGHCGAAALVSSPGTRALLPAEPDAPPIGADLLLAPAGDGDANGAEPFWTIDGAGDPGFAEPFAGAGDGDLAAITFTSGTTSLPKGVPHRTGSLLGNASAFNDAMGFGPENRFYHVMPMAYMAGYLNTLLCPFMAGGSVLTGRAFDARLALQFWQSPMAHEANTLWLAPSMLAALVKVDRSEAGRDYCRRNVRAVCVGTAPLPASLKEAFEAKYGAPVFESYGLSELLFVAGNTPSVEYRAGSVGVPFAEVDLRVVDDAGDDVPVGGEGEIRVRTPHAMAGYLDYETLRPDPATVPEWFPSGDVGCVTESGYVFITGRKKDLIIRGGVNISPRAVEEVLARHAGVAQAAVVGVPHAFYGEEVAAVIVPAAGASLEDLRPELQALCREHLSPEAAPTRYASRDQLPVSVTGKVRKAALREELAGTRSRGENTT